MIELGTYLLGFVLAIPSLAAAYRFLDLGYDLRRYWVRCAAGLGGWVVIPVWALSGLPASLTTAYGAGVGSFLLFHVLAYFLLRAWANRIFRRTPVNLRLGKLPRGAPHPLEDSL